MNTPIMLQRLYHCFFWSTNEAWWQFWCHT